MYMETTRDHRRSVEAEVGIQFNINNTIKYENNILYYLIYQYS